MIFFSGDFCLTEAYFGSELHRNYRDRPGQPGNEIFSIERKFGTHCRLVLQLTMTRYIENIDINYVFDINISYRIVDKNVDFFDIYCD